MGNAPNPGDTNLYEATLNGVDIRGQIRNLSIFEDLKKPYSIVQLLIFDTTDIINNLDFDGSATFNVSFGQAPDQDPYVGTFIMSTINQAKVAENFRVKAYQMQGYSPQMFSLSRIQKAYRDMPMTDVITDLVGNLNLAKPFKNRAPAMNMAGNQNMPWMVNGQQVFQAIRNAMLASSSSVDSSSAYILFENRYNLVLDTLENMLNNPVSSGAAFWQRHLGTDFLNDPMLQQSTLITYHAEKMLDTTSMVQAQSQGTRTFDLFSHGFEDVSSLLQGAAGIFFGGQGGKQTSFNSIPYNSLRPPTYAQQYSSKRRTMASQFDTTSLTIHVPLNPLVTVGTQVNLHLFGALGDIQDQPNPQDGSIIITENRHTVDFMRSRMQGTTTSKGIQQGLLG